GGRASLTGNARQNAALKLAQAKEGKTSDRERRYIDALALLYGPEEDEKARLKPYIAAMERLILAYPEDVEAKAILAHRLMPSAYRGEGARIAVDALLQQVLAKNPEHAGVHHLRIHLWESEGVWETALDSCKVYASLAPNIGHAQHMPGHIYAQLGRWEEAA